MKRVLFILLLLQVIVANAQNWAPLSRTEKFNFTDSAGQLVTKTLWIDSVGFNGTDSIFYLNRVVQYCDSCGYALLHQPQFLQKQAVVSANGNWNFTQPGNMVLNTRAALNDTAFIDSVNNVTGVVTAINITTIFGFTDSVKTIALSSGDSILLSQNFGLQQFPKSYGSNTYDKLTGIQEGRNVGVQVPMLKDIYNFQVGDVFLYNDYGIDGDQDYGTTWTKDSVTAKSIIGDTISYSFYEHIAYNKNTSLIYSYGNYSLTDTMTLIDSANSILNTYPNKQLYQFNTSGNYQNFDYNESRGCVQSYNDTDIAYAKIAIFTDSLGRIGWIIGGKSYRGLVGADTLMEGASPLGGGNNLKPEIFQKNLGLIYGYTSTCFEGYEELQLYGAQTTTDTFGSIYLGIDDAVAEKGNITVTNPVNEIISVNITNVPALLSTHMQLYDVSGRLLTDGIYSGTNIEIPCKDLANGVYILQCIIGQSRQQFKIIKF